LAVDERPGVIDPSRDVAVMRPARRAVAVKGAGKQII